jgi:hypothetical protein
MKKFFIIIFIVLGIIDFLYGVFYGDRISIIAGPGIVLIALYIARDMNKEPKGKS